MTDEEQEGNYPQVLGFILTFAQSEKAMHFYFEETFSFKDISTLCFIRIYNTLSKRIHNTNLIPWVLHMCSHLRKHNTVGSSAKKCLEEQASNFNILFFCQLKPKVLHNRSYLLLCSCTTSSMMETRCWCGLKTF